jgi:hypothetical protein
MKTHQTFDETVHSLGTGKAPGPDGIPSEIKKFILQAIAIFVALYSLLSILVHKAYTPPHRCHSTTCLLHKKGDTTELDNYHPIALMNNLLKIWLALMKNACSKYA